MYPDKSAEMFQDSLARMCPNKTARPSTNAQCVSSLHTLQPQPTADNKAVFVTRAAITIPDVLHHSQPTVCGGGDNHHGIAGIYLHHHHISNNNAIQVLFIVFIIYFDSAPTK